MSENEQIGGDSSSGIGTNENRSAPRTSPMTDEQVKLLEYYDKFSGSLKNLHRDKVDEKMVRGVVRDHVWHVAKFLKSEGNKTKMRYSGVGSKRRRLTPLFGESHERPDLTQGQKCGYPYIVLFHCGKARDEISMEKKAEFWVTWEEIVRHEMQLKRAAVGRHVKGTIRDSKCCDSDRFEKGNVYSPNISYIFFTVLINGFSKKSGSYQLDCYRLQVFKEKLNEPLNARIPISDSGGESCSSGSEDGGSNGSDDGNGGNSSSSDDRAEHYTEGEKKKRIQEREKSRMKENKDIALKLVKQARTPRGLKNLWDIFTLVENDDGTGQENTYKLSDGDEMKIFWMFVDTCVVHMIPRKEWKENHVNKKLSEYIKPSNEAFAMLVLENIAPDLVDNEGNWVEGEVNRKMSTSRYTKGERGKDGKMRGWKECGVKRYNKLVHNVLLRRRLPFKDVMEIELRKHYKLEMEKNEEAEQQLNEDDEEDSERFTGAFDLSVGDTDLLNSIAIPEKYTNIKMVPL